MKGCFLKTLLSATFLGSVISQTLNILTVILSVCNSPASISPFNAQRVMTSNADSVMNLGRYCSHGLLKMNTLVVPFVVQIPCPSAMSECGTSTGDWASRADDAIRRFSMIRVDDYDYRVYVLPEGCPFAGLGYVGPCKGGVCRVWINGKQSSEPGLYLHEIGHNLGLLHGGYKGDPYGDMSDMMGYCCMSRCFNAGNSKKLGFTKATAIFTIPFNTTEGIEHSLLPNEYIQVDDPATLIHWYIQNRQSEGLDMVPEGFGDSVNIYSMEFNGGSKRSVLMGRLSIKGETFSISGVFSITMTDMIDGVASIMIN